MKTNSVLRSLLIALFAISFSNSVFAQFIGSITNNQTPIVEERKGGTTTYSLTGAPLTDDYSWQIIGAVSVIPAANSGTGTAANPFVIDFTTGLTSIQVVWPAEDSTISFLEGNVAVQQKLPTGTVVCPSAIQSWNVNLWSAATASITTASFDVCSGDAIGGNITVGLTGAPNFAFTYTIKDLDGTVSAPVVESGITGATATIALPANLVNTSTTDDQTYVITLTQMNDGFQGDGSLLTSVFTITVHPTVVTGPISSNRALTRRYRFIALMGLEGKEADLQLNASMA